jgi:putative transposase
VEQKAKKPGFPRFKPWQRYTSLEIQVTRKYLKVNRIFVPKLGLIRARGQFDFEGTQKALRVLYKAGKFYAQIVTEQIVLTPTQQPLTPVCGIDLGLTSFLTLDTGEKVPNPRLLRKTASKLRHLNKELARRSLKSSHRRAKTKLKLTATYDRLQRQRRGFHHRVSHGLVSRFNTICVEDLNVKGLVRTRLAKHVHDVAWAQFVRFLTYKAESAGKRVVLVDPRGTSQTCPRCGFVKPKKLSERQHDCGRCDLRLDRDHAAAIVVRNRGVSRGRGDLVSPAPSRVG